MQNFNDNKSTTPKYLEELVKPTPLSVAKLITVWEGLSVETQIVILVDHVSKYPDKYKSKLCSIAKKSSNEYIKYLGLKIGYKTSTYSFDLVAESNLLLELLIKYQSADSLKTIVTNPLSFFEKSQLERVAIIGNYSDNPETIASLIKLFYETKISSSLATEDDLIEILSEYFNSSWFFENYIKDSSYDLRDASNYLSISCVWDLIKICSESVGEVIINNIAKATCNRFLDWKGTFDGISESLIRLALNNEKYNFTTARFYIINDSKYSFETRLAAARYGEIHPGINSFLIEILHRQKEEIIDMIVLLSFSKDSSPTALCVIYDWFDIFIDEEMRNSKYKSSHNLSFAKDRIFFNIKNGFSKMKYSEKRKKLNVIRIYKIAAWIFPWNSKIVVKPDFKFNEVMDSFSDINLNKFHDTYDLFFDLLQRFQQMWESNPKGISHLENWWKTDFDSVLYEDKDDNRASSVIYSK